MIETAQTKTITSVTFDNLVLKQWLYSIGSIRRCELLRKLKADLQDLGLSRRRVHRGLIQLATKPRVVLTREVTARRYGPRKLSIDENEDKSSKVTDSCTTDTKVDECQLQPTLELVLKSATMDAVAEEKYKQNEKVDGIRSYQTVSKRCSPTFEANIQPTLQSFDKALEQLDMINSAKRNVIEKLISKKTSVSPDTSMKTQDRVHNRKLPLNRESMCNKAKSLDTDIQKDVMCISKKTICSKSNEALLNNTLTQNKNNATKENLNSNANKTDTDIKTDYKSSKVKVGNVSKYCQKRKLLDAINEDLVEKKKMILSRNNVSESIERRKRRILTKFRKYFGNCVSVSEDEQEKTILYMNCQKRKKKDSINSCDSGMCSSDGSVIANFEEKSKQARSVPNLTIQEEFNEDTSKKKLVKDDKTDTLHEEDNRNETVTSANETENAIINIKSRSNNLEVGVAKANTQSDKDETTSTENAKGTLHGIVASEADSSSIDTEVRMSSGVSSTFETEHRENDMPDLSTIDLPDIQEDNLNSDFNELLQMTFDSTYQIKSNGNVLSIQENLTKDVNQNTVKDDTTDENSNLETLAKLDIEEDEENDDIPLRETVISINPRVTIETENELVNDTAYSILDNVKETASQKSQLEVIVKEEKCQSNQGSQGRLRVLSSAELGSRWCPTPMNTVISGTDVSSHNFINSGITITTISLPTSVSVSQAVSTASKNLPEPVTITPTSLSTIISLSQTVPTTYTSTFTMPASRSVTVPVSTRSSVPFANGAESNLDSESVNNGLMMICNIIKFMRSSPLISVSACDSMLYSEFDKLRTRLRPVNFPTLLHGIIKLINKKEFEMKPVALREIFCYTPSLQNLCTGISSSQVCNVNDLSYNMCSPSGIATATNKTTVQQNVQRDFTSLQISFQEQVARNAMTRPQQFNQASMQQNTVQDLQNFVSRTISQSHNVPQNDTSMSNVNLLQSLTPSQDRKQNSSAQWKSSHTINQKSVSNRNIGQGIPRKQQIPNPSANANQTEKYMYVPTLNGYVDHPYIAHSVDVSEMNTFYGTVSKTNYAITQNMNPVSTIQQQNINLPYNMQPPNINLKHAFQSQNINSANQQFLKTVSQPPKYNVVHRPAQMNGAQLSSQNTPVFNYPPTKLFRLNNQQPILKNILRNERMYQKVQMQSSPQSQNFAKPTKIRENQELRSKDRVMKTGKTPQISLVSTAKNFNVLKHLSDIQKIMLLKQINFYFGCTTWLEQKFMQMEWQKIQSERTTLLNFHTLLKHLVDKVLYDLSQNKYQMVSEKSQTTHNVNIDVPKEPQITVEGNGAHGKVDISHGKEVQSNVTACAPQQNLNGVIVQNQPESGPEEADTPKNTEFTDETQKSEDRVRDQKDHQRTVQKDNYPRPVSLLETETVLKDTKNSESGIERNLQDSTEKQHTNDPVKVPENSSNSVEEEPLNLIESNKDKPLLPNSHLVTVLISPNSDHVTVLDIVKSDEVTENVFKAMDTEITKDSECSQNEELNFSTENSTLEILPGLVSNNSDTNSESSQDIFVIEEEEICSAQIADVRSISLKSFEDMGLGNSTSTVVEENIVEEEIKVCLCCSKLSTVVCSLCLEAKYCSKECSELHWPEHYKICKPV